MAFKIDSIQSEKKSKGFNFDTLLKTEINLFGSSFNSKKKEAFYTELSVLLDAGVSLKESLTLIQEEQKKNADQVLLTSIVDSLVVGNSFSKAISEKKVFTEYEFYSIKIGEETGTLKKVTKELGFYFRGRNEQKRNITNALSYPIVVFSTAFLAILFMLNYVVPMFADIFKQNQVELPELTKVVISISNGMKNNFYLLIFSFIFLIVMLRVFSRKSWFKKYSALLLLKIPFVGEFMRKIYMAQFTQATALLVGARVPILNSIQLTKKMITFYPMKEALAKIEEHVLLGIPLSSAIKKHKIFDKKMVSLIKVAEETNQNVFIFERLTSQYNEEVKQQSKMLSTILEPLIIIVLGAIVALVLIAMYMPMFQLSTVIS